MSKKYWLDKVERKCWLDPFVLMKSLSYIQKIKNKRYFLSNTKFFNEVYPGGCQKLKKYTNPETC